MPTSTLRFESAPVSLVVMASIYNGEYMKGQ